MNVLIGCECSGAVRDAFRALGHNAWSCDLKPDEHGSDHHIQGDLFEAIGSHFGDGKTWDLLIAHPPCTYLANSGALHLYDLGRDGKRTRRRDVSRWSDMEEGARFFAQVLRCGIKRVCCENPVMHGYAASLIGQKQAQTIQPYQFGDDASKRTGLWLVNLPMLKKLDRSLWFPPRMVNGRPRWSNQTDSGQNREPPSADRQTIRSRTYGGIARAMAEQWGSL